MGVFVTLGSVDSWPLHAINSKHVCPGKINVKYYPSIHQSTPLPSLYLSIYPPIHIYPSIYLSINNGQVGEHDLTKPDGEKRVKVCGINDHPQYSGVQYDYSVLTLCEEVTFTEVTRAKNLISGCWISVFSSTPSATPFSSTFGATP